MHFDDSSVVLRTAVVVAAFAPHVVVVVFAFVGSVVEVEPSSVSSYPRPLWVWSEGIVG